MDNCGGITASLKCLLELCHLVNNIKLKWNHCVHFFIDVFLLYSKMLSCGKNQLQVWNCIRTFVELLVKLMSGCHLDRQSCMNPHQVPSALLVKVAAGSSGISWVQTLVLLQQRFADGGIMDSFYWLIRAICRELAVTLLVFLQKCEMAEMQLWCLNMQQFPFNLDILDELLLGKNWYSFLMVSYS